MQRFSKLMTPKKGKDSSSDGAGSPVIEEVQEETETPEIAKAKRYFRQICQAINTDALNKHDFKMLITKLIIETGNTVSPSEEDIEEAFILADEDKGGTVDIDEFVHLFELILADKINGIHLGEIIDEKLVAKGDRRRTIFLNALTDKREEKKMRDVLNQDANSMPEGEYIQYAQRHLRQQTSSALSVAKSDWEGRNKHTVALSLGNYGELTESAKNRDTGKKTLNNTPASEMAEYNKTHGRKEAQTTLAIAKNEWELRVKETTPQDIGNLGTLTVSAQHRNDAATFDNTGAAEITQYHEKHGRALTSASLTCAREEWEARDKHTEVDDIGHLGILTKVAQHRLDTHGVVNSDNTGAGEMEKFNELHGREIASLELTKAKEEWEARDKHTQIDDIGHLGQMTISAQIRNDNRGITTAENTPDMEFQMFMQQHDRELISADLVKSRNEWLHRHKQHELEVLTLFQEIDTDHSGGLDINEIIAAAKLLNLTHDEAIDLFNEFEIDDDGCISLESFRAKYTFSTISKAFLASRGVQPSQKQPQFQTEAEKSLKDAQQGRSLLSSSLSQHNNEWKKREENFNIDLQLRTEAFKKEAMDYFNSIDIHHHGHIVIEDFRTATSLLQLTQDEIDTLFYDLDIDGNGDIDVDEFYSKYSEFKKRINIHQKKFVSKTEEELKSLVENRELMSQQLANAKHEWTLRQKEKNKTLKQRIEQRKKEDAIELENAKKLEIEKQEKLQNSSTEMFAKLQLKQKKYENFKKEEEIKKQLKFQKEKEEYEAKLEFERNKKEQEKIRELEAIKEASRPRWRKMLSRPKKQSNQRQQNNNTDLQDMSGEVPKKKSGWFGFRKQNNLQKEEEEKEEILFINNQEIKDEMKNENNNIDEVMNKAVIKKKKKEEISQMKQSETPQERKARILEQRRKVEAIKEARLLKAQAMQLQKENETASPVTVLGNIPKAHGTPL